MIVCIHVNKRPNNASNWHPEKHRVLYNQQNFITCQILFFGLVRKILLCEKSGCMRGMDIEAYNNFSHKRQVLDAQNIACRVSWRGKSCSIVLLLGNVLSIAPVVTTSCYYASLRPHPTLPMHFTTRIPVQKKRSDVNTWGRLGSQNSELSLHLLMISKSLSFLCILEVQVTLFLQLFNLPLIEYDIACARGVQLIIFLGYVIDLI